MKAPNRGTAVSLEGMGSPLFVKGPNPEDEEPTVWVKYEGGMPDDLPDCAQKFYEGDGDIDEGYGRGIVELPYEQFKDRRIR